MLLFLLINFCMLFGCTIVVALLLLLLLLLQVCLQPLAGVCQCLSSGWLPRKLVCLLAAGVATCWRNRYANLCRPLSFWYVCMRLPAYFITIFCSASFSETVCDFHWVFIGIFCFGFCFVQNWSFVLILAFFIWTCVLISFVIAKSSIFSN